LRHKVLRITWTTFASKLDKITICLLESEVFPVHNNKGLFHLQFSHVNREWYESLSNYQPNEELLLVIGTIIPPTWRLRRSNVWFQVSPTDVKLPRQGWKIHISAIPSNCEDILRNVANVCIQMGAPFKFALDKVLLSLMVDKSWAREASGKFITIYPLNNQHFHEIIEKLYGALQNFIGPYILSDRRYKDSRVIYYRYGGIDGFWVPALSGDKQYMLISPNGDLVPDLRRPYWNPPPWVTDPFEQNVNEESEPVLKDGRYQIQEVLNFSVTGGVYLAKDLDTDNSVVIKEARPATGIDPNGNDAIDRLQKEYRVLRKLQGTGIAPSAIDLFWDWEHLYLVEEHIPGMHLGQFTIGFNPIMRVNPNKEAMESHVEKLRKIWASLAHCVAMMHEKGIVYGDLSLKNVIVRNSDIGDIQFIDFEATWEEGIDKPTQLFTPGFTRQNGVRGKKDDIYSLGAVMLGTLFPVNNLFYVEPSKKKVFLESLGADLGLPEQMRQIVERCMSDDPSERPAASDIEDMIRQCPTQYVEQLKTKKGYQEIATTSELASTKQKREYILKTINGITSYIRSSADIKRDDRLFPADPNVFYTNPLSITYGAAGVAYTLSKIEGEVPKEILSWILSRPVNAEHYPPGLYLGSAGIAWVLWEIGLKEVALHTMSTVDSHPLLWDSADVFYGTSGYGLTCLRFYLGTGDQMWLERAKQAGDWLLRSKVEEGNRGCYWPDKEGKVWLGYSRGASGIALFLLYLSLASGDKRFLDTGISALAFDLAHVRSTEDGYLSVPRGTVGSFENVITHYWLDGSAGVATTLLRYWTLTKNDEYLEILERLIPDTIRKYTIFPSLFRGLSGLGNFLLDAYDFTGEERYLHDAYMTANSVDLFKIQRSDGITFPGEQLYRISTDFGTGSSGIALFLHRLAYVDQRLGNFNFTLDQFLQGSLFMDKR
jgi:serine/threonine protein kinase